jgi:hypothetical protein
MAGETHNCAHQAGPELMWWVENIYVPQFGYLGKLPPCADKHPLCLILLETGRRLWRECFGPGAPTAARAASQAEFLIRIVPNLHLQIASEIANNCDHQPDTQDW